MIYELKNLKVTLKVKKEYYIYPLLSLVSDFGHFPFLLFFTFLRTRPCTTLGAAGLDGIVGPYKGLGGVHFGSGAKMGRYPRAPIQAFEIDVSADGNY